MQKMNPPLTSYELGNHKQGARKQFKYSGLPNTPIHKIETSGHSQKPPTRILQDKVMLTNLKD